MGKLGREGNGVGAIRLFEHLRRHCLPTRPSPRHRVYRASAPGVYVPVMTAFWSEVVEPAGQSPVGQSHQAPSLTFPIAPQASAMSLRLRRALPPRRAIVLFRGTQDGRVLAYDFKTGKPARWIQFSRLAFFAGCVRNIARWAYVDLHRALRTGPTGTQTLLTRV